MKPFLWLTYALGIAAVSYNHGVRHERTRCYEHAKKLANTDEAMSLRWAIVNGDEP